MLNTIYIEGKRDRVSRDYRAIVKEQYPKPLTHSADVVVAVRATQGGNVEEALIRNSAGHHFILKGYDETARAEYIGGSDAFWNA